MTIYLCSCGQTVDSSEPHDCPSLTFRFPEVPMEPKDVGARIREMLLALRKQAGEEPGPWISHAADEACRIALEGAGFCWRARGEMRPWCGCELGEGRDLAEEAARRSTEIEARLAEITAERDLLREGFRQVHDARDRVARQRDTLEAQAAVMRDVLNAGIPFAECCRQQGHDDSAEWMEEANRVLSSDAGQALLREVEAGREMNLVVANILRACDPDNECWDDCPVSWKDLRAALKSFEEARRG